jgi:predicted MFS family arabinose efflux permease
MADPNYRWKLVALLFAIGALNYGDRTAISSVFPLLRKDLGMSDVALAAVGSFFLWAYAIGSPLAGSLADRFSRSGLIAASLAAWSLTMVATAFVASTNQLLLTRILLGVAECAYIPAAVGLIADHHEAKSRGAAIGIHVAGLNFGMIAGGTGAGFLAEQFGWRFVFLFLGGTGVALAAFSKYFLRDTPRPASSASAAPSNLVTDLPVLFRIPSFAIVLVEGMIVSIGTWIFLNWLPLYFSENYSMSLAGAGFIGTFPLQIASTTGVLAGGFLSDRYAAKQLRRRMLLQTVCYLAAAPFLLTFLAQPALALIASAIFAFAVFRTMGTCNENPITCDLLPPNLRSTAIGLCNAANCLAGGIGIFAAGALKQSFGLHGVFGAISVIMLICAALTYTGYRFFLGPDLEKATRGTSGTSEYRADRVLSR